MKRAIGRQLEDTLHRGGYYDAKVSILGNVCQVYKRDVAAELIALDVIRQRTIVEKLNKLGVRVLEIRHLGFFPVDPFTYELK
jgi:hypothetical protein